jgi:TRAP-type mannitol/chloroaromatic compound transport system substrate-binding protein
MFGPTGGQPEAIRYVVDQIGPMTGGRIEAKLFYGGELVPSGKETDAILEGTLEASITSTTRDEGKIGFSGSLNCLYPGGITADEYIDWGLVYGGLDLMQEMWTAAGYDIYQLPPAMVHGPEPFGYFNKEINTMADFKGMKFRTAGIWGAILQDVYGGAVTMLPGSELYQALERGVLDAFEYGPPGTNWPLGFHEIAKYMYVPGIHAPMGSDGFLVNGDAWRALPTDLQETMWWWASWAGKYSLAYTGLKDAEAMKLYDDYASTHDFEVRSLPVDVQLGIAESSLDYYNDIVASGEDPMFNKMFQSQLDYLQLRKPYQSRVWPAVSIQDITG